MGFITSIIVGGIAGFLAGMVMKSPMGLIGDIVVGVIGGFIGGWLSSIFLGANLMTGFNLTSILTALVGAIILLAIVRLFRRA